MFVIVFRAETSQGATKMFTVDEFSSVTNIEGPDQTLRIMRKRLIRAYNISPSIRQVFADDVTFIVETFM